MSDNLILDTCALIWLATGSARLSKKTLVIINKVDVVFVSAITAWEISLKAARNQLEFSLPPLTWFRKSIHAHSLTLAKLSVEILVAANELPWHHRDPADRFIIATAKMDNLQVVTTDARFEDYDLKTLC